MSKQVITADIVRQAIKLGQNCLYLEPGCIVTQQATDDAKKLGLSLIVGNAASPVPAQIAGQAIGANGINPLAAAMLHVAIPAHAAMPQVAHAAMPQVAHAAPAQIVVTNTQTMPTQATTSAAISQAQAPAPISYAQAPAPISQAQTIPPVAAIAPVLPVGLPTVQVIPGHNPMAAPPITQADRESLIAKVRAEVLKALPTELKADANLLDTLIKKTLEEKPCLTCSCDACPSAPPSTQLAPLTPVDNNSPLTEVGGLVKVNNQALGLGKLQPHSVNMVDALDKTARVSYLEWDNTSFSWTFQQPEILVVLEGSLHLKLAGQSLTAMAGDVLSIPANVQLELGSSGYVKCTTVNPA